MILLALSAVAFILAAIPAVLFLLNLRLYCQPPVTGSRDLPAISVLIPARNEESSIANAVKSALDTTGVNLEIIVMDDASADRTAEVVRELSRRDARVRLECAPDLPAGWNGKQHACWALAQSASHSILCFMDADVTLAPEALARMAAFLADSGSGVVSGFPLQVTETWLEWLLLPLIHFVLLGFLPLRQMRRSSAPSLAAGCGQFLMARRDAYFNCGGHSAIRTTMHDGLLLPRLFRQHGYRTDIADLTHLATCRMYRNAGEVWRGLSKNATEGLAAPARIVPATVLLLGGQVLPFALAGLAAVGLAGTGVAGTGHAWSRLAGSGRGTAALWVLCAGALLLAYLPRFAGVLRFQQPLRSALLHPVGIAVLVALQWMALARKLSGKQATWKARAYSAG